MRIYNRFGRLINQIAAVCAKAVNSVITAAEFGDAAIRTLGSSSNRLGLPVCKINRWWTEKDLLF